MLMLLSQRWECNFTVLVIIAVAAGSGMSSILIKDNSSKPYLHQKIAERDGNIFPEKIQIKIQLTKLPGLLFYGFYKMYDVVGILKEKEIKLTFQGQQYNTSLQDLCKCDPCLYQPLTFTFQVNGDITMDCNGNKVVKNKSPTILHRHSVHSFAESFQNELAHLYLINIPSYINHAYHYETLAGCIQEVKYKDFVLEMDKHGPGISNECIPHCTETTCNGGKCLETFDFHPLCDCQFTFLNGDHCNSALGYGFNARVNLHFSTLKLSWNSSVEEILVVSKGLNAIEVIHKHKKLFVSFKGSKSDTTITIEKNYSSTDQHILIISLDKQIVNITYKSQGMSSWTSVTSLLPEYSFNLKYSSIIFLNNKHTEKGDLVYKTHASDYKWFNLRDNVTIGQQLEENIIQQKKLDGIDITIIVLPVSLSITIVGVILFLVKYKKLHQWMSRDNTNNETDIPLLESMSNKYHTIAEDLNRIETRILLLQSEANGNHTIAEEPNRLQIQDDLFSPSLK